MTERIIITGSASCGKTTVINELRKIGERVLEEVAREVHEDRFDNAFNPYENAKRVALICKRQLKRENYDFGNNRVFLDRGIVDCFVYGGLIFKNLPEEFQEDKFDYKNRYSKVFILDVLPFEKDDIRIEKNSEEVRMIHEEMYRGYLRFGYNPIRVPEMPVVTRVEFILNNLGGKDD